MAKELQDWIIPWIDDHYNKHGTDTTKVYGDGKKVQIVEVSVCPAFSLICLPGLTSHSGYPIVIPTLEVRDVQKPCRSQRQDSDRRPRNRLGPSSPAGLRQRNDRSVLQVS